MFKVPMRLKRRDDMTLDASADWWLREHAPLAAALPDVRGVHFDPVAGEGTGAFDGVPVLWFDSQADFEAACATPHGKAVVSDSMAHGSRRERAFVAGHRDVPGP